MCRMIKTKALDLKRNLITISQMTKGNPHVERFTCVAYCSRTGISFPHSSHCFAVSTENEGSLEPILTCFTAPEREPSERVCSLLISVTTENSGVHLLCLTTQHLKKLM